MATTELLIRTFVNGRLQEAFVANEIDAEIVTCFNDLTKFNLLKAPAPGAAEAGVDGDVSIAVPADFQKLISITPTTDGGVQKAPLRPIPGGFKEYRNWMSNSIYRGTPTHYVKYGEKFFVWPTLNASFDFEIEYYKNHDQAVGPIAAIAFLDTFTNALNFGTTYFAALFRKKTSYVNIWRPIYFEERALMIRLNPPEPSIVGA